MNNIDSYIENQANEAALINLIMYLYIEDVDAKQETNIKYIVNQLQGIYDSPAGYEEYISHHLTAANPTTKTVNANTKY